jgi:hypothetical protein
MPVGRELQLIDEAGYNQQWRTPKAGFWYEYMLATRCLGEKYFV